jgi:glycosyltransferase involved in cell wall biosynthesis
MRILHILPHAGGGIGTVLMAWLGGDKKNDHVILCLDSLNEKVKIFLANKHIPWAEEVRGHFGVAWINIEQSDIIICHFWDHPMLAELIASQLPPCRLAFWCHKNYDIPDTVKKYPDLLVGTSPIQGLPQYVWSTGNMDRFFELQPMPHEGFNVGYVGTVDYKKLHKNFMSMCYKIGIEVQDCQFNIIGDGNINELISHVYPGNPHFITNGKVDDVAPYLQSMDVFGYPLRPDHYGTCEQVIGEAMAAGLPVVAMDNPCERTIIQEGVTGFMCKSEEEYIDNIVHLYHKPNLRKWMGQNAREAAMTKYNVDNMADQWNYIFELMMAEPKKERIPIA